MTLSIEKVQEIKEKYPVGTRILVQQLEDKMVDLTEEKGTVSKVDDIGGIHVKWDNGKQLALYEGVDKFKIIENYGIVFTAQNGMVRQETMKLPSEITLDFCYKLLNVSLIDIIRLEHSIDIIVDDEGLLKWSNYVSTITICGENKKIAGNFLMVGSNSDGEFIPLNQKQLNWIEENITYSRFCYKY